MSTELVVLPQEVEQLAQSVSVEKRNEVQLVLNHVFNGVSKMREQLDSVTVVDENDKVNMKLANTIRLGVREVRLNAEKEFDSKRAEVQQAMLSYKTEDALWLKAKQTMQILTKEIEESAKWKESTKERIEAERKENETQLRIAKVAKFNAELHRSEFENMSTEMFDLFLAGIEKQHNDKIEAERKAEEERLAAIEADRLERERIKAENERLQQEAEQKEKELAEERRKQAEILETERKEAARVQALKDAENAKLQAELKAKQDAEIAAEQKRKDDELKAQHEAAKAAKAPRKKKLQRWVGLFEIPIFENDEVAVDISAKFDAFKKWALEQVNKL